MQVKKVTQLTLTCLCLIAFASQSGHAQRKKQIAVLNFDFTTVDIGIAQNAYGNQENLAVNISDKLMNNLVAQNSCVVVERSRLQAVLIEQNLGVMGRIDPSTAARVGQILGVDKVIIGSVSVFDLQGLPKNSQDYGWGPGLLHSRIEVNYRIVDTTTGVIEAANQASGTANGAGAKYNAQENQRQSSQTLSDIGRLGGNSGFGRVFNKIGNVTRPDLVAPKVEPQDIRSVVQSAVDAVVSDIAVGIGNYLSGASRQPEAPTHEKVLSGRIIDVQGPTIFISGLPRASVRIGDRLYVRRTRVKKDPSTGREIRISDKIGEVEITEIQEEAVVGSFSGSQKAQEGDMVTNTPGMIGAAAPAPSQPVTVVQSTTPQESPKPKSSTTTHKAAKSKSPFAP